MLVGALRVALMRTVDDERAARRADGRSRALVAGGAAARPAAGVGRRPCVVQVVDAERPGAGGVDRRDRLVPLLARGELRRARRRGERLVERRPGRRRRPVRVRGRARRRRGEPVACWSRVRRATCSSARAAAARCAAGRRCRCCRAARRGRLAGRRGDAAAGRGAARPARRRSPAPARRGGCRCPPPTTRCAGWPRRSTACSTGSRRRGARQRAFVADAAHELRSPLATCGPSSRSAQRAPGRDRLADAAPRPAAPRCGGCGRLVDDLLLLARLDAARPARAASRSTSAELVAELAARTAARGYASGSCGARAGVDRGRPRRPAAGWSATWSTTRCGTRRAAVTRRRCGRTARRADSSTTTAPGSRRRTGSGSSTGSPGSTTRAAGRGRCGARAGDRPRAGPPPRRRGRPSRTAGRACEPGSSYLPATDREGAAAPGPDRTSPDRTSQDQPGSARISPDQPGHPRASDRIGGQVTAGQGRCGHGELLRVPVRCPGSSA